MSQGAFFPGFSNDYLLKHGSFFMKPHLHPDGFVYPTLPESARYRVYRDNGFKFEDTLIDDGPLDFVIKTEKPPTPPSSTSPDSGSQILNGMNGLTKNGTWIPGKQKLSWDSSTVASYNPETKMFRCVVCNAVGFLSRIAEHYLGTHTSAKVFQCLHCPYSSTWSRCVRMHMAKHHGVPNAPPSLWKGQPLLEEIFQLLTNLKATVDSQGRSDRPDPEVPEKKFVCPKCPYTTDRRDLFLRHENIHKEDKPYHCYICFKLFNRADHVKKHFLRIHRGHPYDISLVRRRPPRGGQNHNNNNNNSINSCKPMTNGHQNGKLSSNFMVDKLISNEKNIKNENEVIDLSQKEVPLSPSDTSLVSSSSKQLKTFHCPCCEWEGVDNWCLRRHMNTHLKTFECTICNFKVAKAEKLFTHVYRSHRKLVCTKCRFLTEVAQEFDTHLKDCCYDLIGVHTLEKLSDDSNSEGGCTEIKVESTNGFNGILKTPGFNFHSVEPLPNHQSPLDLKPSVSLLHNSISYCYPAQNDCSTKRFNGVVNGMNGFSVPPTDMMVKRTDLCKNVPSMKTKADIKVEVPCPPQCSTDIATPINLQTHDQDDDITCWSCGCEFADMSSLNTHTELYHREDLRQKKIVDNSKNKIKKFSCAICNFNSDKQKVIIEHMRFHTGEVLFCRAGAPCIFKTVCDSTLEQHVQAEHDADPKRCPHCGLLCFEKIPFIRHYRKSHHAKSCSRCRTIKHFLDPKTNGQEESTSSPGKGKDELVRPYLHHNPYSKKSNGISPYAHCNAAMSKVAVAIPQSLQQSAEDSTELSPGMCSKERKSRKQTSPKKFMQLPKKKSKKKLKKSSNIKKFKATSLKICRLNHAQPFVFKNNANYFRHLFWSHFNLKFKCRKCNVRYKYDYQLLLHRRKQHV